MLEFNADCVVVSRDVAAALIEFACKDATRPTLGIGIDRGKLGATDGHSALVFDVTDPARDGAHNECRWSRDYVSAQLSISKALKEQNIRLEYSSCTAGGVFPPLHKVMPQPGFSTGKVGQVGFDPALVGRLAKVTKACGAKFAALTTLTGELYTLGFTVRGIGIGIDAHVAIMPSRI